MKDWKQVEAEAKRDLEAITTDNDATRFIRSYLSADLQATYLKIYRSQRHEMLRSPREAIDGILALPIFGHGSK